MNLNLLYELRYVAAEVGYREAKRMPVEVRRWWIGQMQKEAQQRVEAYEEGQGIRRVDAR